MSWQSVFLLMATAVGTAWAQQIAIQELEKKFAGKAVETVEVNLDGALLGLAGKFLNEKKPDEAKAKQLLQDIKAIYVRVWEFEKEGEYGPAEIEAIRSQLKGWSKVVDVRSSRQKGDNAGVYMQVAGDKIQGLVVVAAEPKELTVVNIVGSIDPERLRDLGGQFGIPSVVGEIKKSVKQDDE
jgi:hypothetical protein